MKERRVVVTGLGMVSPLGMNVPDTWRNIVAGKSGVAILPWLESDERYPSRIAATIKGFNPEPFVSTKDARKMDLFVQYGMVAAAEALADAALLTGERVDEGLADRVGVVVGSGIGGLTMIEANHQELVEKGPKRVSPFFIPGAIINMVAGQISIKYGFRGPNISIVTACTTGAHNIGHAARMLAYGDADVMLAGGAEMATTPLGMSGFAACRALSTRNDAPERASRPWDRSRDGFVLGDGAGVLVLETYEHAKARGAKIYAELSGFGMSADAFHMTAPHEQGLGAITSMRRALESASIPLEKVDYINAHGTSTPVGDMAEVQAVKKFFGAHAAELAMSSTKSMTGHLLGAAGAIEAIFCVLAIRDQIAPPTINLDDPDEGCDLNFVAHEAQPRKIDVALNNSFGFGGTNGSLVFRRVDS